MRYDVVHHGIEYQFRYQKLVDYFRPHVRRVNVKSLLSYIIERNGIIDTLFFNFFGNDYCPIEPLVVWILYLFWKRQNIFFYSIMNFNSLFIFARFTKFQNWSLSVRIIYNVNLFEFRLSWTKNEVFLKEFNKNRWKIINWDFFF